MTMRELRRGLVCAAELLGVRRATSPTCCTAGRYCRPEMALRMQAWHDIHAMRRRPDEISVTRYSGARAALTPPNILRPTAASDVSGDQVTAALGASAESG
jgi:hypothetical protein